MQASLRISNRALNLLLSVACCVAIGACSDDDGADPSDAGAETDSGAAGSGGSGGGGGRDAGPDGGGSGSGGDGGECAEGFVEVDGECLGENGTVCDRDGDCESGHCVGDVCCATECDDPGECHTARGATCVDGETCEYPVAEDGTACDDGDACTDEDTCSDGTCEGSAIDCDDGNVCTADSCDPEDGCINDGEGITTAGCLPDDLCNSGYVCAGNVRGDCVPTNSVDCSHLDGQCIAGRCDPEDGSCYAGPADDGSPCSDGDVCTNDEVCEGGVCQRGTDTVCEDDGNPCTVEMCDAEDGCVAVPANENGECDDGNACTMTDRCNAVGVCVGSNPKVCTGDTCNDGTCDPETGECGLQPKANNTPCNDGNSCTTGERCTGGTCTGGTNACGPNATDCHPGTPNTCECMTNYVDNGAGQCVPSSDECMPGNSCGTAACGANSQSCTDPSNTCGDRVCTCHPDYVWNGTACVACPTGQRAVNGQCVCDMNGTFAVRVTTPLKWAAQNDLFLGTVIEAGEATTYAWAIHRHTGYGADGQLQVERIQCGATTPDICSPALGEAYAQYLTNQIWGSASMPSDTFEMTLPSALANDPFVTPRRALLLGITLNNPLGAWPASRDNVDGGSGTRTNGAAWADHDGDMKTGVTSYAVPPGGIGIDSMLPDPPFAYDDESECPRGNPSAARWDYEYWPVQCGLSVCRVVRFQTATRNIHEYVGTIDSCDLITGDVEGPYDAPSCGQEGRPPCNQMKVDARIANCERTNGNCTPGNIAFFDSQDTSVQQVMGATFVMKRVVDDITCAQVRAMSFD